MFDGNMTKRMRSVAGVFALCCLAVPAAMAACLAVPAAMLFAMDRAYLVEAATHAAARQSGWLALLDSAYALVVTCLWFALSDGARRAA